MRGIAERCNTQYYVEVIVMRNLDIMIIELVKPERMKTLAALAKQNALFPDGKDRTAGG